MHSKMLASQANGLVKSKQILNQTINRCSNNKGKQWMLLTAARSYSKEGPEAVVARSGYGQKVMAIRR